jgi:hypothetical protein
LPDTKEERPPSLLSKILLLNENLTTLSLKGIWLETAAVVGIEALSLLV